MDFGLLAMSFFFVLIVFCCIVNECNIGAQRREWELDDARRVATWLASGELRKARREDLEIILSLKQKGTCDTDILSMMRARAETVIKNVVPEQSNKVRMKDAETVLQLKQGGTCDTAVLLLMKSTVETTDEELLSVNID